MQDKLSELLLALAENLGLQRTYQDNPDAVVEAFGLNQAQAAALRSGDEVSIKALTSGGAVYNVVIGQGLKHAL